MVGLFMQQHYLPFNVSSYADNERFQASRAESLATQWFKNGKFEEPSKAKIPGFSEFIKSMKSDQGNATVAEVQELLNGSKIIHLKWKTNSCVTIILADGTIIYIRIKDLHTNDYFYIVDKFFRFPEPALDVAYSSKHVLFMFPDNRLLLLRKEISDEDQSGSKSDLIQPEVTVSNYQDLLPSLVSKKIEKQVAINDKSDLFMVWWSGSKDDVFPWSPKPEQRANILIYALDENDLSLISYLKTDNNLLKSSFIPGKYNHVCTLEQSCDSQGNIIVNEVIHEITRGKLTPICETAIPLQSELKCYSYDEKRRKLALGCCDASIVVYTQDGKVTHYTKASFIPFAVTWHNDGYLVFVSGDRGQFQIFDIALSPLLLVDNFDSSPSLTKELLPPINIERLCWSPIQTSSSDSTLLIRFETGVMIILRLAMGRVKLTNLCNFHLTNDHYPEAVKVLKSVYWNSDECLHVVYQIFTFLMQRKHSDDVEYNLEHLLATYFVPAVPIEEPLRKRHAKSMRVLARKFFMWLLRAKKLTRAFQIAISLSEEGLLRKLHAITLAHGEISLASEINKRIQPLAVSSSESRSSSSGSDTESACSCPSSTETSEVENDPLSPVSVIIPRPELLVLEPPSPYRNPTVEPPKTKHFYFGEKPSAGSSVVENALIADTGSGEGTTNSSTIEVINFGPV